MTHNSLEGLLGERICLVLSHEYPLKPSEVNSGRTPALLNEHDIYVVHSVRRENGLYVGQPPYTRVVGIDRKNHELIERHLAHDSYEYMRVKKWVGCARHQRALLNNALEGSKPPAALWRTQDIAELML